MNGIDATEANEAAFRRCVEEAWNGGRLDALDAPVHPDVLRHHPRDLDADARGIEALRAWIADIRAALPDLRLSIERLLAENDRVMAHLRGQGTHRGDLAGIPASGRALAFTATVLCRCTDGRLHECWLIADEVGLSRQLGAPPSPG